MLNTEIWRWRNLGGEIAEYTLHSTLIIPMDREAFKSRSDGGVRDGKTQTIKTEADTEMDKRGSVILCGDLRWHIADDKPNGASFPSSVHLIAPAWTGLTVSLLFISIFLGLLS